MRRHIVLLLFICLFFSFFVSSQELKVVSLKVGFGDTIINNPKTKSVIFYNTDTQSLFLKIYNPEGLDFSSRRQLLNSALSNLSTDKEKCFALWEFCAISGFHYEFPYQSQLPDNEQSRALITFPYFMCGEKAAILCELAQLAGIPSRKISLNGHIVSELFYDDKWHMFDADEDVIFTKDGDVLSVVELAQSPRVFFNKKNATIIHSGEFKGFNRYWKLVSNCDKNFEERILHSKAIENSDWSMNVRLNPSDSICFDWKDNSLFSRLAQPLFRYRTKGTIQRNLNCFNRINDTTFIYEESLPYYIKEISFKSPKWMNCKISVITQDRETGMLNTKVLLPTTSKESKFYELKFDAPSSKEIYYNAQILISGTERVNLLTCPPIF